MFDFAQEEEFENSTTPSKPNQQFYMPTSPVRSKKQSVLAKYPRVFQGIDIETLLISPILLSKSALCSRIEVFYDQQVETLLRQKHLGGFDLPRMIRESIAEKFKDNPNYGIQALCNIVYSAEKHGDAPEVALFLNFLISETSLDFLFYLFMRQQFKVLTITQFLSCKKADRDFAKIRVNLSFAEDIVKTTFHYDQVAVMKLLRHLRGAFTPTHQIAYYEFLVEVMRVPLSYRDMALLEHLLALYSVKPSDEGSKGASQPLSPSKLSQPITPRTNSKALAHKANFNSFTPVGVNEEDPFDTLNAGNGDASPTSRKLTLERLKDRMALPSKKSSASETELASAVFEACKSLAFKIVNDFVKRNELRGEIQKEIEFCQQQLAKKLVFMASPLLRIDRARFFLVMRSEVVQDEKLLAFWEETSNKLEEIRSFPSKNGFLVKDLVRDLAEYPTVAENFEFLLNMTFGLDLKEIGQPVIVNH